jgi:hypothetical protein
MSTLTADALNVVHHHSSAVVSGPLNQWRSVSPSPDITDQNTLIRYVYCFIKNFIGASGTNTVAIDNKIEQAMDLVKSHLMFAVREEVEVLKEKIAELMERISQLEYENGILRANASQETLAQLHSAANSNPANPNT